MHPQSLMSLISGNPEPRDLISSSEPPGSFPTFNHVMKSERSDDDDEIDDEPSEVSLTVCIIRY